MQAMVGAGRKVQRPRKAKKSKARVRVKVLSMTSVSPSLRGEEAWPSRSPTSCNPNWNLSEDQGWGKSQSKASCPV